VNSHQNVLATDHKSANCCEASSFARSAVLKSRRVSNSDSITSREGVECVHDLRLSLASLFFSKTSAPSVDLRPGRIAFCDSLVFTSGYSFVDLEVSADRCRVAYGIERDCAWGPRQHRRTPLCDRDDGLAYPLRLRESHRCNLVIRP
jgi:hypothetical protein